VEIFLAEVRWCDKQVLPVLDSNSKILLVQVTLQQREKMAHMAKEPAFNTSKFVSAHMMSGRQQVLSQVAKPLWDWAYQPTNGSP
jgi:hypothetical protein